MNYPSSPEELKRIHPDVYKGFYKTKIPEESFEAVPCPIDVAALNLLYARMPGRKAHSTIQLVVRYHCLPRPSLRQRPENNNLAMLCSSCYSGLSDVSIRSLPFVLSIRDSLVIEYPTQVTFTTKTPSSSQQVVLMEHSQLGQGTSALPPPRDIAKSQNMKRQTFLFAHLLGAAAY